MVIRCEWEDRTWSRSPYIWVDKDFALARGYHQGYPKKLGDIWMTRPITVGKAGPRLESGGRFGATLTVAGQRIAEAPTHIDCTCQLARFRQRSPDAAQPLVAGN